MDPDVAMTDHIVIDEGVCHVQRIVGSNPGLGITTRHQDHPLIALELVGLDGAAACSGNATGEDVLHEERVGSGNPVLG